MLTFLMYPFNLVLLSPFTSILQIKFLVARVSIIKSLLILKLDLYSLLIFELLIFNWLLKNDELIRFSAHFFNKLKRTFPKRRIYFSAIFFLEKIVFFSEPTFEIFSCLAALFKISIPF